MDANVVSDIIEWDTVNWAKFLDFIDESKIDFHGKKILALGEHNGGMSLYFALRGGDVLCSDLDGPTNKARSLHKKYGVDSQIQYAAVDAIHISDEFNREFDVVTFKSVFGGIGSNNNYKAQEECVDSIYRSLKNGGYCIFADNMRGSFIHMFLRKYFSPCGRIWHYETDDEVRNMFRKFVFIKSRYFGVLGTLLGRNEPQRRFLGKLDSMIFDKLLPDTSKYIGAYIFQKQEH